MWREVVNSKKPWRMDFSTTPPSVTRIIRVHVPVNVETGQMDMGRVEAYDDERKKVADGWEWRRFELVEVE